MNTPIRNAAVAVALSIVSLGASADTATVNFIDIGKMTDVPRSIPERDNMEAQLRDHLANLSKRLPSGQELKVDFVDIDLAGDEFPRIASHHLRVLKGQGDRPRLHLRYRVEQNGQMLKSGERELIDSSYLMSKNSYDHEIYSHEKQMLHDWFRKEIVAAR